MDGAHFTTLKGEGLVEEFKQILSDYVGSHYGGAVPAEGVNDLSRGPLRDADATRRRYEATS